MVTQIYEKEYAFTNTYLITQAFYPPYYPPKNTISRTSAFAKYLRSKRFLEAHYIFYTFWPSLFAYPEWKHILYLLSI